ncbi:glycosyltransferase, partial [Vibrio sp. 10N.222.51.C8]|uniref:glycosyltransferase n=1 Tax=Vibrio sp. 10N.222.51.C8 TaxID=3229624 RepID=UPI00354B6BD3
CKSIANDNINFTGYIDNNKLSEIYLNHDVFILPSKSEVWGLVVEEALCAGLPVIVSSNVGCYQDLVVTTEAGLVFETNNSASFEEAIEKIEKDYNTFRKNVLLIDFEERDRRQVDAYNV